MEVVDIKHSAGQTRVVWRKTADGSFSLTSSANPVASRRLWKAIWKWKGPMRVKTFLWILAHDSLLTNQLRVSRGIDFSDICPRCEKEMETSLHALRDCEKINHILLQLIHPKFWDLFLNVELED